MTTDLNANTPAGVLAYCEYLISKGYASSAQINPWRTAIQKVFETVEGNGWEALDLASVDLDQYAARFQTLAGAQYKAESIASYKRRVVNALDAHAHYRATGRPPSFRQRGAKSADKPAKPNAEAAKLAVVSEVHASAPGGVPAVAALMEFPFPLNGGRVASLKLPPQLSGDEVNRLSMFLRSLQVEPEEQRQLTGRAQGA